MLERLLQSLSAQTWSQHLTRALVVVADNDATPSSADTCKKFRHALDIAYVHVPTPGIPQSRNAAVRLVPHDCQAVCFVDDDQWVESNWLSELLRVQATYNADVVGGPVFPELQSDAPKWATRGAYFVRSDYAAMHEGERVAHRAFKTNNLLVRRSLLAHIPGPFDTKMALTGGTDTVLAIQMAQRGATMVWAPTAVAREMVPATRTTISWVLKRAFRTANTELTFKRLEGQSAAGLRVFIGGIARLMYFVVGIGPALLLSPLIGMHRLVNHLRVGSRGLGLLTSLTGHRYNEYRSAHSPRASADSDAYGAHPGTGT